MDYVLVEDGQVIRGVGTLPHSYGNVSGLVALSQDDLAAMGWFPVVDVLEDIGPGQIAGEPVLTVDQDNKCVVRHIPAVTLPPVRALSRFAFRSRFTLAEKAAIYTAAESNVQIRVFLDDLAVADEIDLDLLDTVQGVQALEAAGLLVPGRAQEILA